MTPAIRFYRVRAAFPFAHLTLLLAGSGRMVANPEGNRMFRVRRNPSRVDAKRGDHSLQADNEQKLLTLSLDEFLRRFLLHLLPEGFVRIRNFGLLANRKRATTLPLCFHLLGAAPQTEQAASPT